MPDYVDWDEFETENLKRDKGKERTWKVNEKESAYMALGHQQILGDQGPDPSATEILARELTEGIGACGAMLGGVAITVIVIGLILLAGKIWAWF